jgi:hypothetical protein
LPETDSMSQMIRVSSTDDAARLRVTGFGGTVLEGTLLI